VASRTQIVCLCEGARGTSIDGVFINKLLKALKPSWVRPEGSNVVNPLPCGSRAQVVKRTPDELKRCLNRGSDTTLMVWADCDNDCADADALKNVFWNEAEQHHITKEDFDRIVFVFAKDRLENWIEFLTTGKTDESHEGPRVKHGRTVADAAKKLADLCLAGKPIRDMPLSLRWSCEKWRELVKKMK